MKYSSSSIPLVTTYFLNQTEQKPYFTDWNFLYFRFSFSRSANHSGRSIRASTKEMWKIFLFVFVFLLVFFFNSFSISFCVAHTAIPYTTKRFEFTHSLSAFHSLTPSYLWFTFSQISFFFSFSFSLFTHLLHISYLIIFFFIFRLLSIHLFSLTNHTQSNICVWNVNNNSKMDC